MKANAKIFKGIEYVQINELPHAQSEMLAQTINPELYIKLLIDGKIVGGCLQYKDYSVWYQEHVTQLQSTASSAQAVPSREVGGLTLKNA